MMERLCVEVPSEIVSLRLFGSVARGDADDASDLDILAVVNPAGIDSIRRAAFQEVLNSSLKKKSSVSWYSTERICEMFTAGHLFAWHIYKESLPLTENSNDDFVTRLSRPSSYTGALNDISSLREILMSIPNALAVCPRNATYEAGILFVCLRNIALSASWFTKHGLDFSRRSPYAVSRLIGARLNVSESDYSDLIRCRLNSQRGIDHRPFSTEKIFSLCITSMDWVEDVRHFVRNSTDEHRRQKASV